MTKEIRHGLDQQLVTDRKADDVGAPEVVRHPLRFVHVLAQQVAARGRPIGGGALQDLARLATRRKLGGLGLHLRFEAADEGPPVGERLVGAQIPAQALAHQCLEALAPQ